MADLETLSIKIKANATSAYNSILKLAAHIDLLGNSIAKIEVGKLNDLATGLTYLNSAIVNMNGSISKRDFNKISNNISTLETINVGQLNSLAGSLTLLSSSLNKMAGVVPAAKSISTLVNAIGKLSGENVNNAISNIPRLEVVVANLITRFSKLPTINQSIIDFTNSLANLAQQGGKAEGAIERIDHALGSFGETTVRTVRKGQSLESIIGKLYAKFWLFMRGARALKSSFISAADYLEAFNYFDVTAKKIGKDTFKTAGVLSAEDYAEAFTSTLEEKLHRMSGLELDLENRLIKTTNAKSLGLNLTELTQYQASIASISNAMGNSQIIATSTAKAFSMLAGDMGSLKNLDFEQVSQNLQSALTGQARALYRYGIDLTEASLEQYAFNNGITKSVSDMSQAEKAQLRLLAILEQSKVAWGDLANTINSPSNQLRMLQTNLKEVGTVFGQLFIPIMESALPVINGLSMAIKQLLYEIAQLLGIEIKLDSFGQFGEEIDADIEGMEELNKAIEKTKKGIREFDELKVISSGKGKGSDAGDQIDLTKEIIEATNEYEKVWNEAYERMTNKASEIAAYISGAFEPIKNIIEDFHIGDFFKAGEDVSKLIISIFDFISKAIDSVDWTALGQKIGDFLAGLDWTGILKSIGGVIASAIQAALNIWTGAFSVAPFETAIITAFAILKFTGLGENLKKNLVGKITGELKSPKISKEVLAKLGTLSLGIGLAITIDNVKNVKEGQYSAFSLRGLLQSGISSLFSGAGIALLAKSIGFASGGVTFAIGAAVSLVVSLFVSGVSQENPYEAAEKVWAEEYAWINEHELDRLEIKTNIELKEGEIDTQFLQIDDLSEKVYELSLSYDKLTDGEKGMLKYYSDELIKVMPELANQIDTVTGAYKGTREELDKLIQKQKEQITVSAYQANMTELQTGISSAKYDKSELEFQRGVVNRNLAGIKNRFIEEMGSDYAEELWDYILTKANNGTIEYFEDIDPSSIDAETLAKNVQKNKALNAIRKVEGIDDFISVLTQKDKIESGLATTESTLSELTRKYNYYADELEKILGETVPQIIDDANQEATDKQNKSKLPDAVEKTMTKVNNQIQHGDTVSKANMNKMFNSINEAFAGLEDGKPPAEIQAMLDNIKDAIINNSPELELLMAQLAIKMEDAFSNALKTKDGNLLWNKNNISGRLDADFNDIEEALHNNAKPGTKTLERDLLELFGVDAAEKLPKSVNDGLKKVADTIEKGQGKQAVMDALKELETSTVSEAEKLGMYLERGTAGGIYKGKPLVKEATEDMVKDGFENTYMETSESSSPSRLARRLAKYLPEGAALGIEDGIPTFESAVKDMVGVIGSLFGNVKYNIPDLGLNYTGSQNRFNYGNMDSNNSFVSQLVNMANTANQNGQTEVVFKIEGDPYGMFRVIREENDKYKRQHSNRSAFN